MNLLWAIHKYLEIKNGKLPKTPVTLIFGAKAAPAYTIAKDIIHAILCLQQITEQDPEVSPISARSDGRKLQRNKGIKNYTGM